MAPADDHDISSDDEEFMQKVDLYLNSRDSTTSVGILGGNASFSKVVKFAVDEEELEDAAKDTDRTRQELLHKISRLTVLLKEAEEQNMIERDKRKKKEKNLMKLAKELKKRNAQKEYDMERMEEVRLLTYLNIEMSDEGFSATNTGTSITVG
jgi:NADH dehydrogenase/NADH:ubiquinone oxidoreductase subunit G